MISGWGSHAGVRGIGAMWRAENGQSGPSLEGGWAGWLRGSASIEYGIATIARAKHIPELIHLAVAADKHQKQRFARFELKKEPIVSE